MKQPTYRKLASLLLAIENCKKSGNQEWELRHKDSVSDIMEDAPSGSGFDNGTTFDWDSTPNKLVFHTAFHHMDDGGGYDGWTDHGITVRPDLAFGIDIKVSGPNRNEIKDYIHECFHDWLTTEAE